MSKKYYCCEVCVYYTSCEPNPFGVCSKFEEKEKEKHFSPEDVRRMTAKEVLDNFTAIMSSMKMWKRES
jgi:hypothetical protein